MCDDTKPQNRILACCLRMMLWKALRFCVLAYPIKALAPVRPHQQQGRGFSTAPINAAEEPQCEETRTRRVPIHLLAGFLGSGKTTTLQHLLHNTDTKLGLIVNDVAAVNIDAKLVRRQTEKGVIELQNGCACCSMSDELMDSLNDLMLTGENEYEAIIVELSGVADPVAIRNLWKGATREELAVTKMADLESVVTVVDSSTFGTDFLTWDTTKDREWNEENCGNRKISELLAEQVETADTIILNKRDLCDNMDICESLVRNLNPGASTTWAEFGKVPVSTILSSKAIQNEKEETTCNDPTCADTSHSHSHGHDATATRKESEIDAAHSHDHAGSEDHSHSHAAATVCNEPGCTENHEHSHDHSTCTDPTCTEDHSHEHNHNVSELGIRNFCFRSTKPFNAERLMKILYRWPIPIKNGLDEYVQEAETTDSPFAGVLRSKGFCWMAPSVWDIDSPLFDADQRHDIAMYWSHAGRHFDLQAAGPWWATQTDEVMRDFFGPVEYEAVKQRDFVTKEFGDRRQEIVFIGVDLKEDEIRRELDECLLNDDEMKDYRAQLKALKETVAQRFATA